MKKLLIILLVLITTGCGTRFFEVTDDSKSFKEEYEALNGERNALGSDYLKVKINKANPFKYVDYDETLELLESGTGILFFSRPGCPYCRSTMNATIDFALEAGIFKINYFNPADIREENGEKYKTLLDILDEYLTVDTVTQKEDQEDFDPSLKRIVVPHMFFINEGEIISHYQEGRSDFKEKLTEDQEEEIKKTYKEAYNEYQTARGQCTVEC